MTSSLPSLEHVFGTTEVLAILWAWEAASDTFLVRFIGDEPRGRLLVGRGLKRCAMEEAPTRGRRSVREATSGGFELDAPGLRLTASAMVLFDGARPIAAQLPAGASLATVGLEVLPPLEAAMRITI